MIEILEDQGRMDEAKEVFEMTHRMREIVFRARDTNQ
jgi:hypothetical protein